jgi:hypothetical protein
MRYLKRFNESLLDETFIIKEVTLDQALDFLKASDTDIRPGVNMTDKDRYYLSRIFPDTEIKITKCVADIIYKKKFLLRRKWIFGKLVVTKFDDDWYLAFTEVSFTEVSQIDRSWICDGRDGLNELQKILKR